MPLALIPAELSPLSPLCLSLRLRAAGDKMRPGRAAVAPGSRTIPPD